jgi:putative FmdB family regulatory protein
MPVYEYQCGACGHAFEEWQKIKDPAIKTCPKCGKDAVERLISQTAFMLKGGGWYKDLYSSSKSAGNSDSGSGKSDGGSSSKPDSSTSKSDSASASSAPAAASSSSSSSSGGSGSSGSSTPSK